MKKTTWTIGAIVCGIAVIVSCKTTKNTATTTTAPTPKAALTYTASVKKVLDDNCNRCHKGGKKGDFTNYAGVKEKIDEGSFNKHVFVKKDMPPKEPLTTADFDLLKNWVEAGAPE